MSIVDILFLFLCATYFHSKKIYMASWAVQSEPQLSMEYERKKKKKRYFLIRYGLLVVKNHTDTALDPGYGMIGNLLIGLDLRRLNLGLHAGGSR